ncbi:hypothetical protein LOTGIDRAFT_235121 [Lottia gigantea]|uniref:Uncharacterized protein n=1 Tax=Lottia gigantea TaxID=225164 RepID=V3Z9A2_LOTGI|nr:hypothetical protein LOTGIDRAFT_235121 [Lottia gigantea]ESO87478.1 hypothetical protein LOTGIDRAFT_235121 [Lottia gigantea]
MGDMGWLKGDNLVKIELFRYWNRLKLNDNILCKTVHKWASRRKSSWDHRVLSIGRELHVLNDQSDTVCIDDVWDSLWKWVFESEVERDDSFLEKEDLMILLNETHSDANVRETIFGYPSYPLYHDIGNMLQQWLETRSCPVLELPKYDLLDEQSYTEFRAVMIISITPLLDGLKSLWSLWTRDERKFRIREILMLLGKRGIMDLLGIRKTVGTKEMFPPSRQALLESFQEKHSAKSQLGVGARALAKHYHRDEGMSWWGQCTGTEAAKNADALRIVNKILDGATWINIHWLPQDVFVIEVRQEEGYGARWNADGSGFRGFLEPQMVDGHEIGWRH